MTILLLVGLTLLASTTIKAADITDEYPYKIYGTDVLGAYHILLSDYTINTSRISGSYVNLSNGSLSTISDYYWVTSLAKGESALHLFYQDGIWNYELPSVSSIVTTNSAYIPSVFLPEDMLTVHDTKPSYFPPITNGLTRDDVNSMINEALNATTSITTSANNLQTQATNAYVSYINGNMTLSQLQSTIDNLANQLQNLNNSSSATLADKVAVNNAITQTQLVQDAANKDAIIQEMEEDLTVSSNVSSTITGKINEANNVFNQYSQGNKKQSEAVTQINQYITQLTQLITPQTTTADINAINAAINTINGIKDSITSHSDLDDSVSEDAQQSDEEEIEYLENITAETTDDINSLKSKVDTSINQTQANQVKEQVITPLLQNTLIVKVLPIAALFMVLAVTLGFKYKL